MARITEARFTLLLTLGRLPDFLTLPSRREESCALANSQNLMGAREFKPLTFPAEVSHYRQLDIVVFPFLKRYNDAPWFLMVSYSSGEIGKSLFREAEHMIGFA